MITICSFHHCEILFVEKFRENTNENIEDSKSQDKNDETESAERRAGGFVIWFCIPIDSNISEEQVLLQRTLAIST